MKLLNLQVTPSWGESEAGCWMGLDFKIVLTSRRNSLELEGAFGEPRCQALGMCGNEYSDKHNPANTCLMRRDQMGLNRVRRWTKIWVFVEKNNYVQGREDGVNAEMKKGSHHLFCEIFLCWMLAFGCDKEKTEPLWERLQRGQDDFLEACPKVAFWGQTELGLCRVKKAKGARLQALNL